MLQVIQRFIKICILIDLMCTLVILAYKGRN